MLRILNKKGQTNSIISIIPTPLLFILFILLLVVIGSILNPIFNSFGVYCKSDQEVVKLSESNIVTNLQLISTLPSFDEIAGESINPNGFLEKCTEYVNGSYRFITFGCSECDIIDGYTSKIDTTADVCVGDAYKKSDDELTWIQRTIKCPIISDCVIPDNYYFEVDSGLYECEVPSLCADIKLSASRDSKLESLGSVPYYTSDESDTHYSKVFKLSCTEKLRVEPTIAGVPIFNVAFWVLILILIMLIWVVINFFPKK